MESITKTITAEEDGLTVRQIMRRKLYFSARGVSRLTRLETGIMLNGVKAIVTEVVHEGDELRLEIDDQREPKHRCVPGDWPLDIVWEDEYLIVINKPAGMASHIKNLEPGTPNVGGALAARNGTDDFIFHPVNRLDLSTSGLMIVAKSAYIHDRLQRMIHGRRFQREYRAICLGRPDPPTGVIKAKIGRDETSIVARMVREDGSRCVTTYEMLAASDTKIGTLSLMRLLPLTGRTHQLRVHMAHIGCPIAGDDLYGGAVKFIGRPALHSCKITLFHPIKEEWMNFSSPLPADMRRIVKAARF